MNLSQFKAKHFKSIRKNTVISAEAHDGREGVFFYVEHTGNYYFFSREDVLGRGAFGIVYQGYPVDINNKVVQYDSPVAVKYISDTSDLQEIYQEAHTLSQFFHKTEPLVLYSDKALLVTDYLSGKTLSDYSTDELTAIPFGRRINIAIQLIQQLERTHHNTIGHDAFLHRDIKPENVILNPDKSEAHLIDFGLATSYEHQNYDVSVPSHYRGTPHYLAPETVTEDIDADYHGMISSKTDIFSMAAVLMKLFSCQSPTDTRDEYYASTNPGMNFDNLKTLVNIGYDADDLLEHDHIPGNDFLNAFLPHADLRSVIKMFVTQMGSLNHDERPDSSQCLRFFMLVNKLLTIYKIHRSNEAEIAQLENENNIENEDTLTQLYTINRDLEQQYLDSSETLLDTLEVTPVTPYSLLSSAANEVEAAATAENQIATTVSSESSESSPVHSIPTSGNSSFSSTDGITSSLSRADIQCIATQFGLFASQVKRTTPMSAATTATTTTTDNQLSEYTATP